MPSLTHAYNDVRDKPVRKMRSVVPEPRQCDRYVRATVAHGGKVVDGNLKNRERALMNLSVGAEKAKP